MSELDEQIDKVVDELWKIAEPYPTYSIRATKAIKALIANQVQEARIDELNKLWNDPKAIFETDNFTDNTKLLRFVIPQASIKDRLAELKGDDK